MFVHSDIGGDMHTRWSHVLPFPPHENKREKHDIYRIRNRFGDLEAHITRLFKEAASDSAARLGDYFAGLFVNELENNCVRKRRGLELLSVLTYHNFRARAFGFPSVLGIVEMNRPTVRGRTA
jgi:hypothetical protein